MSRGPWITAEQLQSIQRMARIGYSLTYIAMQVGVERTAVGRVLRRGRAATVCLCGRCRLCCNRLATAEYRRRKKRLDSGVAVA